MDGPRIPRSPILRLQPIMETQFKSRKPQQKVSVVICGLRISSLANLQRELFREPDDNQQLLELPSEDEIRATAFSIGGDKVAKKATARAVQSILQLYGQEAGQLPNLGKSSIIFSKGTDHQTSRAVRHVMGLSSASQLFTYLGTSIGIDRRRTQRGVLLKAKIHKRINH
ncbi:hypothetical protein MRB53_002121 [Persea americana]|uniref:Uncharacterized protein n=1 Tax=Persea americana TaxID=3435 RepID=A0ACC2MU92_PERAE|nr:hypothetical protein MRB53_002121 [Persea americana]